MTRAEAMKILTGRRAELAASGLRRLALFGSVARDEAGPDSDVDVQMEFGRKPTFDRDAGLYDCLEDVLARPVDLVRPVRYARSRGKAWGRMPVRSKDYRPFLDDSVWTDGIVAVLIK